MQSTAPAETGSEAWRFVAVNHRNNHLLWDEEDQARRTDVADADIAANKRAIDRYNQERNNFIEEMDKVLVAELQPAESGVARNSETPR